MSELESRTEVARGGAGSGESLFNAYTLSNFATSSGNWVHNSMNVLNATEIYSSKWLRW